MVNTGNTRRESAQAYLIPLLAEAGFNVVADNCEALPCVFETRLPGLDYDLAMYISTVSPDPHIPQRHVRVRPNPHRGERLPGSEPARLVQRGSFGTARRADVNSTRGSRRLVKRPSRSCARISSLLPTLQFPNIGAYRTDKVANTQAELANYRAVNDWYQWEDVDGDGQIVLGAEQFPAPDCPNPITECANSSWFVWTTSFPVLPAPFDATADQTYEITEMLASEPVVEEL